MAVQSRHLNAVLLERGNHWIYFFGGKNEIAGRRNLPGCRFLEIDGLSHALWRRERHAALSNRFTARNSKGKNTPVELCFAAQGILDCFMRLHQSPDYL